MAIACDWRRRRRRRRRPATRLAQSRLSALRIDSNADGNDDEEHRYRYDEDGNIVELVEDDAIDGQWDRKTDYTVPTVPKRINADGSQTPWDGR